MTQELSRTGLVYLAKVCEQTERFEEMVAAVQRIAKQGVELTADERNLVSVAYKEVMGSRRASWRTIIGLEQKEGTRNPPNEERLATIRNYRSKLEEELTNIAADVFLLVDKTLMPVTTSEEARVFYNKLKADYHRYMAEILTGATRKEAAENSLISYKEASDAAVTHLPASHPLRLGVALNFSVFYFEILQSAERACLIAKQAFDDSMGELNHLNEDHYKESTLLMQLLRDNLTLWAADVQGGEIFRVSLEAAMKK